MTIVMDLCKYLYNCVTWKEILDRGHVAEDSCSYYNVWEAKIETGGDHCTDSPLTGTWY